MRSKIPIPVSLLAATTPRPHSLPPIFLLPSLPPTALQSRSYANPPQKKAASNVKRRPQRTSFVQYDLKDADQYSLAEAVRYLRAFEVGRDPVSTKYELAVKLHAMKNGPTIKTFVKLPKPVKSDIKIGVIAEGAAKEAALKAGAVMAGTDEIFELVSFAVFTF